MKACGRCVVSGLALLGAAGLVVLAWAAAAVGYDSLRWHLAERRERPVEVARAKVRVLP